MRLLGAAVAGFALYGSFQPIGWWWAGWVSVALMVLVLSGRPSWKMTAGAGFLWGFTTALAALPWIQTMVGMLPWIALSVVLGLLQIVVALGIRAIMGARLPLLLRGIGAAAWIVACEAVLARWPFGGFPWLRYAFGQVGGPLEKAATIGSAPLVTFLAAVVGAGVAVAIIGRDRLNIAGGLGVAVLAVVAGVVVPQNSLNDAPSNIRIAAVQGNVPRLGLEFNAQQRAVLANHVDATKALAQQVRDGEEQQPDLVIWPENSSDISPFTDPLAERLIDEAAREIGVPIIVGTFSYENGTQNTMVVWDPETGPGDMHEKIYLQPFGETMPYRDLLRKITPLVDMAGDMTPGDGDAVVDAGGARVGLATCFEVIFDRAFRDAVNNGANLLATPTNNATFGYTDMTYQQLAMSRFRAIEHDRAVVVAATSGVSAIVEPDGTVQQETEIFEQKVLTATLPMKDDRTFATRYGVVVEAVLVLFALVVLGVSLYLRPHPIPDKGAPGA